MKCPHCGYSWNQKQKPSLWSQSVQQIVFRWFYDGEQLPAKTAKKLARQGFNAFDDRKKALRMLGPMTRQLWQIKKDLARMGKQVNTHSYDRIL